MKTLYDLLSAHPSDNAEALRAAFRKAAKANHPDLHGGDTDAAGRFRQIADAYEVLRDADRRATYDRLLQFERERVGRKSKSSASYPMRNVVSDAVIAIGLAIVLAGGFMTYAHISRAPARELARTGERESARIAVVQPAEPTNTNTPDEQREGSARSGGHDLVVPNSVASAATHDLASEPILGPVAGAAGLNAEVVDVTDAFAVSVVRTDPKSAAEHPDQTAGTGKLDPDGAQLVKVLSSSGERDSDGGKSFSSALAMPGDKRDMKRRENRDINPSGVKISDTKLPARPAAKRQAAGRTEFEQRQTTSSTEFEQRQTTSSTESEQRQAASPTEFEQSSLADRKACSGSCARDVPHFLGVGF
jgi:curved DNA-binding protein CbpA